MLWESDTGWMAKSDQREKKGGDLREDMKGRVKTTQSHL
jgi:hypothetical protein